MSEVNEITIRRPDNFHLHLRGGEMLAAVLIWTIRHFARGIIMPNRKPPIVTVAQAGEYREEILAEAPEGKSFEPLMTLHLTDTTSPELIAEAKASGFIYAVKSYPEGATTNSDHGVTDIKKTYPALEMMEELGLPLLLHGEVTDRRVEVLDRERVFIDTVLTDLVARFPKLKIVLEHITTADAAEFVRDAPPTVAATVTPQHLLMSISDLFRDRAGKMGLQPHNFCLPVLKHGKDQTKIWMEVTAGEMRHKFFAGTDSAPHITATKESSCGCAGCFCEPAALSIYAEMFSRAPFDDWPDRLERFLSVNGAEFYGLPLNEGYLTLVREDWEVPTSVRVHKRMLPRRRDEEVSVTPWLAGETLSWRVKED